MSDLSNEFHADLDAIKAEAEVLVADAVKFAAIIRNDLPGALQTLLSQVEPIVVATAKAAFSAALAALPGGAEAAVANAGTAAVATLVAQGKPVVEADALAIQATVIAAAAQAIVPPAAG